MKNKTLFAATIATSLFLGGSLFAADLVKGGESLLNLSEIKSKAGVEALKRGEAVSMSCAKCKSITVHRITTEKGHIKTTALGEKHLCPGCSTTLGVVGVGKRARDTVKHICTSCGDKSVSCCETKPGRVTAGM